MFEYILVVYWTMAQPEYVGNFESCAHATQWCQTHCKEAEYTTCLHEDYMYLPKNFMKKEIQYEQQ